jgi:hypothetical protein
VKVDLELQGKSIRFAGKRVHAWIAGVDKSSRGFAIKIGLANESLAHGFYKGYEYCKTNGFTLTESAADAVAVSDSQQYVRTKYPSAVQEDRSVVTSAFKEGFINGAREYRESHGKT